MTFAQTSLADLVEGIQIDANQLPEVSINDIALDSRKIKPNDIFVALKGDSNDGTQFIPQAQANGACAVLVDSESSARQQDSSIPLIKIKNLKQALPLLADRVYADPSAKLSLIAVTGTNGKTTCAHLIAQSLTHLSVLSAVIGTAGRGLVGQMSASSLTTPDVFELRRLLAEFVNLDVQAVVFEASSHGLQQNRLDKLSLDYAVFTNLSHDHLDYHENLDAYAQAKLKLFQFPNLNHAVMNADHPLVENFSEKTSAKQIWFYGKSKNADVRLLEYQSLENGLAIKLQTTNGEFEFQSPLIGQINVENLTAVFTTLLAYGFDEPAVCDVMPLLKSVPGRMEVFGGSGQQPMIIVDYAHTPDALEKALVSIKDHVQGSLICVFGCGGDRDKEKRPKMGMVAQKNADSLILTDDNPRFESPQKIICDIQKGLNSDSKVIHYRPAAIKWAIDNACAKDVVLIAGKGHETTQQIRDTYIQMSDRRLVEAFLESQA